MALRIKVACRSEFSRDELHDIFRLRASIFHERMKWDVQVLDGLEVDGYDALDPHYLTARDSGGTLHGCWRLLRTDGPYMLKNSFPALLHGMPAPNAAHIWELSRFALRGGSAGERFGFSTMATESIAGVLSHGHQTGIAHYVTVTTPAIERMLRRSGVLTRRFGPVLKVGLANAVALWIDVENRIIVCLISRRR